MKRILVSILGMAVLSACVGEIIPPVDPEAKTDDGTMHAYIVAPDGTRTDFDSYVGKFAWSDGDKIAIHLSDGTFYETPVNAGTGAFTCSTTSSKQRDAYAIYPASARDADNYGSPTLKVVLPAEYDISGNTASDYSPVPMVAVNRQGEDDLYFRHVGSLLRITCDRVPSQTRYIAVTFDRNVAGSFPVVNPASDHPTLGEGGNSATVTFRIAVDKLTARTDGIILNVPVPTGDYSLVRVAALRNNRTEIRSSERDLSVSLPRGHGKKLVWNVIPAYYDSMQMVVIANEASEYSVVFCDPSQSYNFPSDLTILWGDGTYDSIQAGFSGPFPTHTYSAEGEYTITIEGVSDGPDAVMIPYMLFSRIQYNFYANKTIVKSLPTPLLRIGNIGANSLFCGCKELESICGDLFSKNPHLLSFENTFLRCESLTDIPENLFSYAPQASYFGGVFQECSGLTCSIPENLFAGNPLTTSFYLAFYGCSNLTGGIPEKLFSNCPLVRSFEETFRGCSHLTGGIPPALFSANPAVTSFDNTFAYCSGLTGPIPANLFKNNTAVVTFRSVFSGCLGLTETIPEDLFSTNTAVTNFVSSFSGCRGLTGSIPPNLFSRQTRVKDFSAVFSGCTGLTGSIPENLFATNPDVTGFSGPFASCSGLTGSIPGNLFAVHTKATNFYGVFNHCDGLSGSIPANLFASQTAATGFEFAFFDCDGLTGDIPEGLFENCLSATNFSSTFGWSNNLRATPGIFTGTRWTKETRFANYTETVNFDGCFRGIGGGTAPNLWEYTYGNGVISNYCFDNSPALTNWAAIDPAWK